MKRHIASLSLMCALGLLAQDRSIAATGAIYCCESESGQRVCGNPLPNVCMGRAHRIIGANGMVIKEVAAPMSAAERAAAEREDRRKELEAARRRSQQLQDRALLDTYSSVQDIDERERRAVDDFQQDLDKASRRMEELEKEAIRLTEESKLYADSDIPLDLKQAVNDNKAERAAQLTVIEAKQKSIEAVKARFDRDRERYKVLSGHGEASR